MNKRRNVFILMYIFSLGFIIFELNEAKANKTDSMSMTKENRIDAGKKLFHTKNCSHCHNEENVKNEKVPDLKRWKELSSPTLWAAIMWNHVPEMVKAFKEENVAIPTFDNNELISIFEYLHSYGSEESNVTFPGNANRGAFLFPYLGCKACHNFTDNNDDNPSLPTIAKKSNNPYAFANQLLSHAIYMCEKKEKSGKIRWPMMQGNEIAHLFEYLNSIGKKN